MNARNIQGRGGELLPPHFEKLVCLSVVYLVSPHLSKPWPLEARGRSPSKSHSMRATVFVFWIPKISPHPKVWRKNANSLQQVSFFLFQFISHRRSSDLPLCSCYALVDVDRFSATAQSLVQVLQVQSNKIEKEKLMVGTFALMSCHVEDCLLLSCIYNLGFSLSIVEYIAYVAWLIFITFYIGDWAKKQN